MKWSSGFSGNDVKNAKKVNSTVKLKRSFLYRLFSPLIKRYETWKHNRKLKKWDAETQLDCYENFREKCEVPPFDELTYEPERARIQNFLGGEKKNKPKGRKRKK